MDGKSPYRLSLVLPAYNEEAGIRQAVIEADDDLAELVADYEILVVDDGSLDGTAAVVEELAGHCPRVRLLRHSENRGYGAALRTGFDAARFERVAFTDADCQFHLADLARLLPLTDCCPIAVGYREDRQDPWRRRFLSRGYNLLARTLLGTRVRDIDCALKVFHRDALAQLLPESTGFFVNTEMLTRARQLRMAVAEAGVRHRPRAKGASKVSLGAVPRTLGELLPFWWSRVLFAGRDAEPDRCPAAWPAGIPMKWPRGGARNRSFPFGRGVSEGVGNDLSQSSVTQGLAASDSFPQVPRETDRAGTMVLPPLEAGFRLKVWPAVILLLAVSALLFLTRLRVPLLEPQEARYAEIPRQMLAEGRFVVPVLHGQAYLDKPPLLYWLVMASYRVFGVSDWAARLVPGLAGVLTVLVTYLWGRRVVGHRAALWGALVLCLGVRFVYLGRMLNMDGLLALWVTAALASLHCGLRNVDAPRWGWWLLAAACCALGVLTKGPVAAVLIAAPLVLYRLLDRRCPRIPWRHGLAFAAVVLALAGPWFAAAARADTSFAGYFFWTHNVVRFVAPFDHAEPVWYFLPGLLLGLLPWTLLLPGLVRFVARRSYRTATRRPPALGFFLLAFVSAFAFFSVSGCKRPAYILPALPPLALALGCYLDAVLPRRAWQGFPGPALRRGTWLAFPAAALSLTAGAGIGLVAAGTRFIPAMTGLAIAVVALAGVVALGVARRRVTWPIAALTSFIVLFAGIQLLLPEYNRRFALRTHLRAEVGDRGLDRLTVICYPQRWDSVSFYLPDAEVKVFAAKERHQLLAELRDQPCVLLAARAGRSLNEIVSGLPDELEFVSRSTDAAVVVGWVRPRASPDGTRLAER
jgi:dolichol-phosphate mannosyltransferase